jgi:NAD(P)-dependent dehydrogenase (short-subunit alcohol dehydrogenase family)
MNADAYRFDGKRALVVGGATGMGAATAALVQDLGAEVVVMDHAEVGLPGVICRLLQRDRAVTDDRMPSAPSCASRPRP